ncbi:MAG: transglutaminase family protein [Spongiibacteraceae bacterium]
MKTFQIDCELDYDVQGPTDFIFHIEAVRDEEAQIILQESLDIDPGLQLRRFTDRSSGNRYFRLHQSESGPLHVRYRAIVELAPLVVDDNAPELTIADLPEDVLQYLMATRYCESDLLERTAQRAFGNMVPGYARVRAITEWIRDHIDYEVGSSNSMTTARDVLVSRAGVCRDFAHLGISFCRALNIPARLLVGYSRFEEPPPDFHAIFEAYLGGVWYPFDATGLAPVDSLVRIGTGRDAKDVAFATIFGMANGTRVNPVIQEISREEAKLLLV